MKVKIYAKEYNFEFDSVFGPLYTYEEVAGDKLPFNPQKSLCLHVLFWCILLRANDNFTLGLEEFMLALNDLELVRSMNDYYVHRMAVLTSTAETVEADPDDKKKV